MPSVHKNNTISFRPSEWERINIEERAALSGMAKRILSHAVVSILIFV